MALFNKKTKKFIIYCVSFSHPFCDEWDDETWFMYFCYLIYKRNFDYKIDFRRFCMGKVKKKYKNNDFLLSIVEERVCWIIKELNKGRKPTRDMFILVKVEK